MSDSITDTYDVRKADWYSPIQTLACVRHIATMYGKDFLKPEFKKAREMFMAAITLLGAYELDSTNTFWLQINIQSESPDVMAAKQTEIPNSEIMLELAQMELTEFEEHFASDDILQFLKSTKLSPKKAYGSKDFIVCFVNRRIQLDARWLSEELRVLSPKSSIYIIGRADLIDINQYMLVSPYPRLTKVVCFNIDETSKKYQILQRVSLTRGTDQKIRYIKTKIKAFNIYEMLGLDEKKIKTKFTSTVWP